MVNETHGHLETNRMSVRKGDPEGLLAVRLLGSFIESPHKKQVELLKRKNIMRYLDTKFQAKSSRPDRIIAICRSKE
jgi:hypothetical protein